MDGCLRVAQFQIGADNLGAESRQSNGRSLPNATTCTDDQSCFANQFKHGTIVHHVKLLYEFISTLLDFTLCALSYHKHQVTNSSSSLGSIATSRRCEAYFFYNVAKLSVTSLRN